jgi:hypothetical protein
MDGTEFALCREKKLGELETDPTVSITINGSIRLLACNGLTGTFVSFWLSVIILIHSLVWIPGLACS